MSATQKNKTAVPNELLARALARRRKTLFPLSSRQVCEARCRLVQQLAVNDGYSAREVRQILNLSGPDEARRLLAKSQRSAVGGQMSEVRGRTI